MDNIADYIDVFGFQSPFLLNFLVLFWILGSSYSIAVYVFYLGGYFLNTYLNEFLKSWLRMPRPVPFDFHRAQKLDPLRFFRANDDKIYISKAHVYGMPSGHAQMSAYGLAFYYFLVERGWGFDWWSPALMLFMVFCFMHAIMFWQRWKSHEHTWGQLVMGTLVGVLFAKIVYYAMSVSLQISTYFPSKNGGESGYSGYKIPDGLTSILYRVLPAVPIPDEAYSHSDVRFTEHAEWGVRTVL